MSMRVCFVMGRLQRGGQFYVLLREAMLCKKRGHEVFVAAFDASEKAVYELHSAGIDAGLYIGQRDFLKALNSCDIIHIHDGFRIFLCARFKDENLDRILRSKPVIVTYHGLPPLWLMPIRSWGTWFLFNALYYKLLKRYADIVIAISYFVANQLRAKGVYCTVLYNGINVPDAKPDKKDLGNELKLLYLGSAAKHKALGDLARAFVHYRNRLCADLGMRVSLTIAGFGVDKYAHLATKYPYIKILSSIPREKVFWLYRSHHVYVTASRWEGFGLAPLEALANGLPVLARNIPVAKEILGACKAVKLIDDFNDYIRLHDALYDIILNYKEYSSRAIRYARNYSWDIHANLLIEIYKKAIKSQ